MFFLKFVFALIPKGKSSGWAEMAGNRRNLNRLLLRMVTQSHCLKNMQNNSAFVHTIDGIKGGCGFTFPKVKPVKSDFFFFKLTALGDSSGF